MPRGDKSKYTSKQKRQAEHIEEGYKEQGVSQERAEEIAWATVNKQDGGGKKSGSGVKRRTSSRKPKARSTRSGKSKTATGQRRTTRKSPASRRKGEQSAPRKKAARSRPGRKSGS